MEIEPRRPEAVLRLFVFRWTIAAKWMVGPSMDNCSEVWEKRILGWNRRQPRSRHCQADEAARQGMAPAPGALICARPNTSGRHSFRPRRPGRVRASQLCVGLAGLAAVELGSANELSRLRLTGLTVADEEETSQVVQLGLNVETLPFPNVVPGAYWSRGAGS
jgi:hypothetical protein